MNEWKWNKKKINWKKNYNIKHLCVRCNIFYLYKINTTYLWKIYMRKTDILKWFFLYRINSMLSPSVFNPHVKITMSIKVFFFFFICGQWHFYSYVFIIRRLNVWISSSIPVRIIYCKDCSIEEHCPEHNEKAKENSFFFCILLSFIHWIKKVFPYSRLMMYTSFSFLV